MKAVIDILCYQTNPLRSLMIELGIPNPQSVADIAIDLFNYCLSKTAECREVEGISMDDIHRISPEARATLQLTSRPWAYGDILRSLRKGPIKRSRPIPLKFSGNRAAAIRESMRSLVLKSKERLLTNALFLLRSMVRAKRTGQSMTIFRMHSDLHTRPSRNVNPALSSSPPPSETPLLN